jgi:hypothetical protein
MAPVRRRAARALSALPLLSALLALGAYAMLLPAGRWQGDDYLLAWFVRRDGWHFLLDRLTGTSPRPVGETLDWLYLRVSDALDRPLVAPFLGALWLAALTGIAAAGAVARLRRPLTLAVLLVALALLLARPGEMFYWPTGAAAYLPCWAGLAAATVLHRSAGDGRHDAALAIALTIAAFSAEIGALTVLFYAVPAMLLRRRHRARLPALAAPALAAMAVCLIVLRQRMQPMHEVIDPASGFAGHWGASLGAALPDFLRAAGGIPGLPLAAGIAVKLLLLVCLPPADPAAGRRPALLMAVWAAALLAGAFASVVLAYHQFGTLCCERHATLRQGMVLLALVALSGLLGGIWLVARRVALAGVVVGLLGLRAGPLSTAWGGLGDTQAARRLTWESGRAPGEAMTLFLAPADTIANADALPPGNYRRDSEQPVGDTPWYAWGVMARFNKHALSIVPYRR